MFLPFNGGQKVFIFFVQAEDGIRDLIVTGVQTCALPISFEVVEGGSRVDDAVWFGIKFAEGGVDYLSVSKGGRFEDAKQPKIGEAVYPYTGESGYECMPTVLSDARGPFGRNVPLAAAIRRALRGAGHPTPAVTSGGITTFEQAEGVLERGGAGCGSAGACPFRTVSAKCNNCSKRTSHEAAMSASRRFLSKVVSRWRSTILLTTLIEYPATSQVPTISGISALRPGATAAWHPRCTYLPQRDDPSR